MNTLKNNILKRRRAVAETITTLLLLGITVVGGIMIFTFTSSTTSALNDATDSTSFSQSKISIIRYDTRDSSDLSGITTLDNYINNLPSPNTINKKLCAASCSGQPNRIPSGTDASGGPEFIVLHIKNDGTDSVLLGDIVINDVQFSWDTATRGIGLDASANDLGSINRKYPMDGKYSIISTSNSDLIQKSTNLLLFGEEVRLVVKLSGSLSNLSLEKPLRVGIDTGGPDDEFVILSGSAR